MSDALPKLGDGQPGPGGARGLCADSAVVAEQDEDPDSAFPT